MKLPNAPNVVLPRGVGFGGATTGDCLSVDTCRVGPRRVLVKNDTELVVAAAGPIGAPVLGIRRPKQRAVLRRRAFVFGRGGGDGGAANRVPQLGSAVVDRGLVIRLGRELEARAQGVASACRRVRGGAASGASGADGVCAGHDVAPEYLGKHVVPNLVAILAPCNELEGPLRAIARGRMDGGLAERAHRGVGAD